MIKTIIIDDAPYGLAFSTDVYLTISQQNDELITVVSNLSIPKNITVGYLNNLNKVGNFIDEDKYILAIKRLEVFIKKVDHDYRKNEITFQQYNNLVQRASALISRLEAI